MEKFLKKHLCRGGTPTPERGEGKGPKNATNANQEGVKGRGSLRAMNEVKPHAVSLSMTRGDLVTPLTATTAAAVCCR